MTDLEQRVKTCSRKKTNLNCFLSGDVNANHAMVLESQGLGVFICERLVNQVRELNIAGLRIKGVSMAKFTPAEVEFLEVSCPLAVKRVAVAPSPSPPHTQTPPLPSPFSPVATRGAARSGGRTLTLPKRPAMLTSGALRPC